jgi:molecular chaperone GrpE
VENVRKRAQRDVEAAHRYGIDKLATELLPVLDSLELAVENADRADAQSLAAGQQATLKLLGRAFEKLNIAEINPLGEPFDPARHEAVLAQPSDSAEPNSVLKVVQRGYEMNGRLLRPARVIVARAP